MPTAQSKDFYETDKAVSEYLFFHYGDPNEFLFQGIGPQEALDFPKRCGELAKGLDIQKSRALDLGCAVGRSTFELSADFDEVIGVDFAHALIAAANRVADNDSISLEITEEGDLTREVKVSLPDSARPANVSFQQGDAMNLPTALGRFDFILMANLIDRLPDPKTCLKAIDPFVNENGIIAITSPYTWLEEYTPKEKWLGGFVQNENEVRSFESLTEILSPKFSLLEERNMPFLIREHCRKNQFSIAHATLWQKR